MSRHKAVRWLCWIAFVAASLLILVLVTPYLVSAYHLEAGGRAVDDLELLSYNAPAALGHLQKAIEWQPDNAQAYRLLSKVYRAQGDKILGSKSQGLTCYTELWPDNPLGHIELAEVYEAVEAEMRAMRLADLVAALPQAAVEAPDVPIDTPHAQPNGLAWHSYVATTAFSLPPSFGERPTLFMHSPSWVTFTLALPTQPATLCFIIMGMDPQTHGWSGDGATFEVLVNGERIFLEHVDKVMAREGWHERTTDLAPWAGREVALALAVTPGCWMGRARPRGCRSYGMGRRQDTL